MILLQEAISTFTETLIEAKMLDPRDRKNAEKLLGQGSLDRVSTEEQFILQTNSVKSAKISIEHKLDGVDADLKFFQRGPCPNSNGALGPKAGFALMYGLFRSCFVPMQTRFRVASHVPPVVHVFAIDTKPDSYLAIYAFRRRETNPESSPPVATGQLYFEQMILPTLNAMVLHWKVHAQTCSSTSRHYAI